MSAPTAVAELEISVHGVVVHTRRSASSSRSGKRTYAVWSLTSW
jgi:hypothetical protein